MKLFLPGLTFQQKFCWSKSWPNDFEGNIPNLKTNDEKKVVISRILERGVGSFFKINDKDVRAKDVSIMFYDSGSGARSSSIISQGNIDQIINFKPIDRKIILEDAAETSVKQAPWIWTKASINRGKFRENWFKSK